MINHTDPKGYYAILEVSQHATYQEIRRSYRKLARKYHPDRNHSSFSEDMIKKINAAFETLSDREKRHQYDIMDYFNSVDKDMDYNFSYTSNSASYTSESHNNVRDQRNDSYRDEELKNSWRTISSGIKEDTANADLLDIPKGRFHIIVEPSLCMAFGSCETLAPKVFVVEKNKNFNPKAKVESEIGGTFEQILSAAQTCPTKAIKIIDRYTGEQIYP
jgi:curved DNA-binding protein CbpA